MRLPERLAAFRANFEAGGPPDRVPAWVHEPMHRATTELIASGAAQQALRAGDQAPEFTLKDADGHEVSSRDLLANGATPSTLGAKEPARGLTGDNPVVLVAFE